MVEFLEDVVLPELGRLPPECTETLCVAEHQLLPKVCWKWADVAQVLDRPVED